MRSRPATPPAHPLSDEVVSLRLRRESDFEAVSTSRRDTHILRWLSDRPADDDTPTGAVLRAAEQWQTGQGAPFVIAAARSDSAIGLINLTFADDTAAHIAYSVFATARGRGAAPRAVRLITTWAFRELGLGRIVLEADRRNAASLRVAEKAGFQWTHDRQESGGDTASPIMAVHQLLSVSGSSPVL